MGLVNDYIKFLRILTGERINTDSVWTKVLYPDKQCVRIVCIGCILLELSVLIKSFLNSQVW